MPRPNGVLDPVSVKPIPADSSPMPSLGLAFSLKLAATAASVTLSAVASASLAAFCAIASALTFVVFFSDSVL